MREFLKAIIANKRLEVEEQKLISPIKRLEKSEHFTAPTVSLVRYLRRVGADGIIAEIKRRSPSKGAINERISVEEISIGYMQAGASALSVLTDKIHFGGSLADLVEARRWNLCPILRKDFVIDEYQLFESRAHGADVVLLIAEILTPKEIYALTCRARDLGLEVILEVHSAERFESSYIADIPIVGVNNRDLQTFVVDQETAHALASVIPFGVCRIAESGLERAEDVLALRRLGYEGFLIGESFMKHPNPPLACRALCAELHRLSKSNPQMTDEVEQHGVSQANCREQTRRVNR